MKTRVLQEKKGKGKLLIPNFNVSLARFFRNTLYMICKYVYEYLCLFSN